jgi:hypothetical protein
MSTFLTLARAMGLSFLAQAFGRRAQDEKTRVGIRYKSVRPSAP